MGKPSAFDSLIHLTNGRHWTFRTLHRELLWRKICRESGPTFLAIDGVGVHDNFFDLGGDSLCATRVAVRILKDLKVEVPLKTLFQAPTIAQLVMKIGENRAGTIDDAELAKLLDQIESLSDEEVHGWLEQNRSAR